MTDRATAAEQQLRLTHGEPMLFGENRDKGIGFDPERFTLHIVDAKTSADTILVHDETNLAVARMLVELTTPTALGVIYRQAARTYEQDFYAQHPTNMERKRSVADLIAGPSSWRVPEIG